MGIMFIAYSLNRRLGTMQRLAKSRVYWSEKNAHCISILIKKCIFFQAYCEAKEAYLAEIESLDENKWIQQFLYSMGKTTYTFDIETKIHFLRTNLPTILRCGYLNTERKVSLRILLWTKTFSICNVLSPN